MELSDEDIEALAAVVRDKVWPLMEERIGKQTMDTIRANAREL